MRHDIRAAASCRSEDGAVAVVAALTLTVLLLFASFAVDIAGLRADRAFEQSVSDMAAAAAGQVYQPTSSGSARAACEEAVAFAADNLGTSVTPVGGGCDVFPDTASGLICAPGPPPGWPAPNQIRVAVFDVDGPGPTGQVVITNPVLDDDSLMQDVSYGTPVDGLPCDRMGVAVSRSREYLFAGAGGASSTSGETTRGAVARGAREGLGEEYATLIVLARGGCKVLHASGGPTKLYVEGTIFNGEYFPGIITVDAVHPNKLLVGDPLRETSACSNNSEIMAHDGSGSVIWADDHIFSHEMHENGGVNNFVFPSTAPQPTTGQPPGVPTSGRRVTRKSVDHLYNCLASYPSADHWSPTHSVSASIDSGACSDAGSRPAYIQRLRNAYQGLDLTGATAGDWAVIGTGAPTGFTSCNNVNGTFGTGTATRPAGKSGRFWFVNCSGGFSPKDLTFEGVEAIVTVAEINTQPGHFRIHGNPATGAVVYIQSEGLESSNTITFLNTFVYVDSIVDHASMRPLRVSGTITWRAPPRTPATRATCETYDALPSPAGAPPAACLTPLSMWSNNPSEHSLGGSGGIDVAGTFFTPNALPFRIHGGGTQDLRQAQFFSGSLRADGGGTLNMQVDPEWFVPTEMIGGGLIR